MRARSDCACCLADENVCVCRHCSVLATARLIDMAKAIGRTDDVTHYTSRLSLLKKAYHERFFHPELGRYDEPGTASWIQSHQVFPLYLDIVPAQQTPTVVAALVNAIHNQSDHVNCGIIGRYEILAEI